MSFLLVAIILLGAASTPARQESDVASQPRGVIRGTAIDQFDRPLVGAEVRVLRLTMSAGRSRLLPAASAWTDDRGVFEFGSLNPARYAVALPPQLSRPPLNAGPRTSEGAWMHPLTYFPNGSMPDDAALIEVSPGEVRAGINFRVGIVHAVSVNGRLSGPSGPIVNVMPRLVIDGDETDAEFRVASVTMRSDGTFAFFGVPAGRYIIRAQVPGRAASTAGPLPLSFIRLPTVLAAVNGLWGELPIDVGDADVRGLTVQMRPGTTVSGRFEFDGSPSAPTTSQLRQILLVLEPLSPSAARVVVQARVGTDGRFATAGIAPGRYFLRLDRTPPGWIVKTAVAAGRDVIAEALDLQGGHVEIVVSFTDARLRE